MALEGYKDARELVMSKDAEAAFQAGFKQIKDTCLKAGFDKTAVDSLQFKASEHILTISKEDQRSGAFHVHADGKPFYALTVEAPGSIFVLANVDENIPPTKLPPQQQAVLLAFELGMNLLPRMSYVLTNAYGLSDADGKLAGGGMSDVGPASFETTLRCDPAVYCEALNTSAFARLKSLVPAPAAPKPRTPGKKFNP